MRRHEVPAAVFVSEADQQAALEAAARVVDALLTDDELAFLAALSRELRATLRHLENDPAIAGDVASLVRGLAILAAGGLRIVGVSAADCAAAVEGA